MIFEFHIHSEWFLVEYAPCGIWEKVVLKKKIIHSLSEIQMSLGSLYFRTFLFGAHHIQTLQLEGTGSYDSLNEILGLSFFFF